jgi:hypothetical protein
MRREAPQWIWLLVFAVLGPIAIFLYLLAQEETEDIVMKLMYGEDDAKGDR